MMVNLRMQLPSQLAERRGHRAHEWTDAQLSEDNKLFGLPTDDRAAGACRLCMAAPTANTSICCPTWMPLPP